MGFSIISEENGTTKEIEVVPNDGEGARPKLLRLKLSYLDSANEYHVLLDKSEVLALSDALRAYSRTMGR